jgi:hypothetical protein
VQERRRKPSICQWVVRQGPSNDVSAAAQAVQQACLVKDTRCHDSVVPSGRVANPVRGEDGRRPGALLPPDEFEPPSQALRL